MFMDFSTKLPIFSVRRSGEKLNVQIQSSSAPSNGKELCITAVYKHLTPLG